jgi:mevalonate kinase
VAASARPGVWIKAPGIGLAAEYASLEPGHPLRAVIDNVRSYMGITTLPPLNLKVTSSIPVASGLGSGAAVSVALIRALAEYLGSSLSEEQVSMLAYEVEKIHHGTPSGIDNTVIAFARPVYFIKGRTVETFQAGNPFTLVIADTGFPAPTRESVSDVRRLWQKDPDKWNSVFDSIGQIAARARKCIRSGKWQELGPLMDRNHALLVKLTVSSPGLDTLVQAARQAGALGAKLSGGGRGGNCIALVDPGKAKDIEQAMLAAGARHTITTIID